MTLLIYPFYWFGQKYALLPKKLNINIYISKICKLTFNYISILNFSQKHALSLKKTNNQNMSEKLEN